MRHVSYRLGWLIVVLAAGWAAPVAAAPETEIPSPERQVWLYCAEGHQRQGEQRYAEAVTAYRRALKINPHQPETLSRISACYQAMKEYRKAVDYAQQALRLNPRMAEAREALGEAYVQLGKIEQAREQYVILLTLDLDRAGKLKEALDAHAARAGR